jgi:hypothetical protein
MRIQNKRVKNVELQSELQEMIDKKSKLRRLQRESKMLNENVLIKQTEEFRRAEDERKMGHRVADRVEIDEQLRTSGLRSVLTLL